MILRFHGKAKFPGYQEIVEKKLTCFQAFGCCDEFKSAFLCMHTWIFAQNGRSKEHGEYFRMGMALIERSQMVMGCNHDDGLLMVPETLL